MSITEQQPETMITGIEPLSDAIGNLEFDREEKARLVALLLAIQYHTKTIISDAEYLKVMLKNEQYLSSSTADKVVSQAEQFYKFLRGGKSDVQEPTASSQE